jgi:hypothetical protein
MVRGMSYVESDVDTSTAVSTCGGSDVCRSVLLLKVLVPEVWYVGRGCLKMIPISIGWASNLSIASHGRVISSLVSSYSRLAHRTLDARTRHGSGRGMVLDGSLRERLAPKRGRGCKSPPWLATMRSPVSWSRRRRRRRSSRRSRRSRISGQARRTKILDGYGQDQIKLDS